MAIVGQSAICCLAVWGFCAVASAQHPIVERGRSALEEADFQGALTAFDEAERAADLQRADLVRLVEGRALANLALGRPAAVETEMANLAAIDPEHQFSAEAPPEAQEHFDRARASSPGPIRVLVESTPQPGGLALTATVENDGRSLARRVRLVARPTGGAWQTSDDGSLTLQAAGGTRIDYYAVAIGPGGAPIAEAGTRASPLHVVAGGSSLSGGNGGGGGGGAGVPWLWVGAGAAAVAVVVVVVLVASSSGDTLSDDTQPSAPVVMGF